MSIGSSEFVFKIIGLMKKHCLKTELKSDNAFHYFLAIILQK